MSKRGTGRSTSKRSNSKRRLATPGLTFHPATPDRWSDVEALFGERGACAGCWCMYWRLGAQAYTAGKGAGNRAALRRIVRRGDEPGVLAYAVGEPIGWCAVAPREEYPRLDRSRVLARLDETPVWSISCLFVARPWRKQGVSGALIEAAVAHARSRGAKIVEGYPVDPAARQADAFVWTGIASAYERAGFREMERRSPTRPIMRRT
ncbi:MAG TPA: GNAT family N-acetyltransferase [Gemmatimonadota bacterium]|nr:GNAT family N-acetyltransferase [Gemmatimonadota bacterium]